MNDCSLCQDGYLDIVVLSLYDENIRMDLSAMVTPAQFTFILKLSFLSIFITSILVIVNAILSAKALGGELGKGLKKIAAGTIFHIILIVTFLSLERGGYGILTPEQIYMFFIITGLAGSILLIMGYLQIYKISKRLKLF